MNERMTFAQCERKAKDAGAFDKATFDVVGLGGRKGARWLDAYFGMILVDGMDGFVMGKDLEEMGLWCENFAVPQGVEQSQQAGKDGA